MGEVDECKDYYFKAIEILTNFSTLTTNESIRLCHERLGTLYERDENSSNALKHKEEVLRISLSIYDEKHPITAEAYCDLGLEIVKISIQNLLQSKLYFDSEKDFFLRANKYDFENSTKSFIEVVKLHYYLTWIISSIRLELAFSYLKKSRSIDSTLWKKIVPLESLLTAYQKLPQPIQTSTLPLEEVKQEPTCKNYKSNLLSYNLLSNKEMTEKISDMSRHKPIKILSGLRSMR